MAKKRARKCRPQRRCRTSKRVRVKSYSARRCTSR